MNHTVKEIMSEVMPQLDHLTTRQRKVIESALILFSEQGYDKTSTSDIAKKAGVAEGTVYKQFKNKRALLYAAILPIIRDNVAPVVVKEFTENLDETIHFKAFIEAFVDNRSQFLFENRVLLKVIINEALTNKEIQAIIFEIFKQKIIENLKPRIEFYIERGEMRTVEVEYFLRTVIAQIFSLNMSYLVNTNQERDSAYDAFATFTKEGLYRMFKANE